MKYTNQQLSTMIKEYLSKVAALDPWGQLEEQPGGSVCECHYTVIENYTGCGQFPGVDVLFLLTGAPKNYQAFTIEDGKLVELHQEHRPEFCLTCTQQEAAQTNESHPF